MLAYMALIEDPKHRSLFETLYLAHRDRMFHIANGILRDTHWAEDAVSEAFLKIAKNMAKISAMSGQEQRNFFVIIVRSCAIDIYRQRRKEAGAWEDVGEQPDLSGQDTVEDTVFSAEGYQRLLRAIDSLPDLYGDVMRLYYVHEYSGAEIATLLGIPENTVHARLSRGWKKLMALLKKEGICP